MLTNTQKTVLLLVGIVLSSIMAGAQPVLTTYRSIELQVAEAQFVVRGTIAKLSRTVLVPAGGYSTNTVRMPGGEEKSYRTQEPEGIVNYLITIQVDETIKGPRRKTAEFAVRTSDHDHEFEQWATRHTPFLCFGDAANATALAAITNSANQPIPSWWNALSLEPPVPGERIITGMVHYPPVFAMDFACLDDPKEILAQARPFAKKGSAVKVHVFKEVPMPAGRFTTYWNALAVPVMPALERIARRLIQAPEEVLRQIQVLPANWPPGYQDSLRVEGVAALRYFKSKKNIALLKPLLQDPTFRLEHHPGDRTDSKRVYRIRASAYETLRAWGVEVRQPVLEEPLP